MRGSNFSISTSDGLSIFPVKYKRYWFVPDVEWFKVLVIEDDMIIKEIPYGKRVYDVKICGEKLIVAIESKIILNEINRPPGVI